MVVVLVSCEDSVVKEMPYPGTPLSGKGAEGQREGERERQRDVQEDLFGRETSRQPFLDGSVHSVARGAGAQRSGRASGLAPSARNVVLPSGSLSSASWTHQSPNKSVTHGHDLQMVEILGKVGDVVHGLSIPVLDPIHRDGCHEFRILAKDGAQLFEEEDKVGGIVGGGVVAACKSSALISGVFRGVKQGGSELTYSWGTGVLPIDVDALEPILVGKGFEVVGETGAQLGGSGQLGKVARTGPSADGEDGDYIVCARRGWVRRCRRRREPARDVLALARETNDSMSAVLWSDGTSIPVAVVTVTCPTMRKEWSAFGVRLGSARVHPRTK